MTTMPLAMMRILTELDLLSKEEKDQLAKFSAYVIIIVREIK